MLKLNILNSKEIKEITKLIESQWGVKLNLDYTFLKHSKTQEIFDSKKGKNFSGNQECRIFIVNKDIKNIEFEALRISSVGMYFCEVDRKGIRLSIEGSQLIGPKAVKNIAEISEEQAKQWFRGEDLKINGSYSGFVILKHKNDFLGNGKFRDGVVLNYVTKSRRSNVI